MGPFMVLMAVAVLQMVNDVKAQEIKHLNPPAAGFKVNRTIQDAFEGRMSVRQFRSDAIDFQVLSALLWSANGINRPETGRRTAPSALNAQDVDVYVVDKQGIWLYEPKEHKLRQVLEGDHRLLVAGSQPEFGSAPVFLLLVSDISRFRIGDRAQRLEWAALDVGMVAQNVLLFCASERLACRPRSWMEKDPLRMLMGLNEHQLLLLNIPVALMP